MKKSIGKIFCILSLFVLGLALTGCASVSGDGVKSESKYNVGEFTSVKVNGDFILNIEVNKNIKENSVMISSEKNIIPLLIPVVNDGVLSIKASESISKTLPITINIKANSFSELSANGAIKGAIDVDDLNSLTFNSNGVADFTGKGTVKDLTIGYHGNSNLDFSELKSQKLTVSGSGVFSAKVYASKSIDLSLLGVGNLTYFGSPSSVTESNHGLVAITGMK